MLKPFYGSAEFDWQIFAQMSRVEVVEEVKVDFPEPPREFLKLRIDMRASIGEIIEQKTPEPRSQNKQKGWSRRDTHLRRDTKFRSTGHSKWI